MSNSPQNSTTDSHSSSTGHNFAGPGWLDTHFLAMQPEYEEMLRWVADQGQRREALNYKEEA